MKIRLPEDPQFSKYYTKHCKYLKLKGLQPKTIEAYARALRRIGNYFDGQLDRLSQDQLLDYFHELLDSHSWSAAKLEATSKNCLLARCRRYAQILILEIQRVCLRLN